MYGMTPVGVFFIAFFPLKINEHALCQQPHYIPRRAGEQAGALPLPVRCGIINYQNGGLQGGA